MKTRVVRPGGWLNSISDAGRRSRHYFLADLAGAHSLCDSFVVYRSGAGLDPVEREGDCPVCARLRRRLPSRRRRVRVRAAFFDARIAPTTAEVARALRVSVRDAETLLRRTGMRSGEGTEFDEETNPEGRRVVVWDLGGVAELVASRGIPVVLVE